MGGAGLRRCVVLGWLFGLLAACSSPAESGPEGASTATSAAPSAARTSAGPTTTTRAPATGTAGSPPEAGGTLPGDLTPNVVEDECLLTALELGALTGRAAVRAENTELAGGGGRRSCFYLPPGADDPAARIDVYASASLPPPELVARIAANGGRALPAVGQGAALVTAQNGGFELAVASATLLAVLTILPGGAAVQPADQAWADAGTAMAARLTR